MTLSDTDSNGKRFHVLLKFNVLQPKSSVMAFERFIMHEGLDGVGSGIDYSLKI